MTEVSFHTGVDEPLAYACRLLRKAQRAGSRVAVLGDPPLLAELDRVLWSFDPLSFVPHLRLMDGKALPDRVADATPIWLVERAERAPAGSVLVNLGPDLAEGFERFERLIEIVGAGEPQRQAGRRRWRLYAKAGCRIVHHERTDG